MLVVIGTVLLVFVGSALGDYVYVRWMQACAERAKSRAASWSMGCTLIANGMVLLIVPDPWLLVPLCMGNGVGTWFALSASDSRHPATPGANHD